MDFETEALVERWIAVFSEAPVLIDPELMRRVLDEHDARVAQSKEPFATDCCPAA